MPERFELEYIGADGERHRPAMIHRAVFGSLERFLGLLIEQYAGDFPLWLAPVQARILPITDKQHEYARQIQARMQAAGLRAELDVRNEKIGYKIRQAEMDKIPVMLVMGGREMEKGAVSLRLKGRGDQGSKNLDEVMALMQAAIAEKRSLI